MDIKSLSKIFLSALLIPVLVIPAGAATTQKKPAKPAPKPVKKVVKPTQPAQKPHIVQGTKQWSGENAELGVTYTIGKDSPINFALNSLEYGVAPVGFGGDDPTTIVAKSNEKIVVLHFILHNPQPKETRVLWATVHFTIVDDKNANHEGNDNIGVEKEKNKLWVDLKPGQKIECYSAMVIPADSEVEKLIVVGTKPEEGVLRYYKEKMKIKPLEASFANPKDSKGIRALAEVAAQPGTFYPMKELMVRVDSMGYSTEQLNKEEELSEDSRYFVCSLTIKNAGAGTTSFGWGELSETTLVTDQGEEINSYIFLLPTANKPADYADLKPGQERSVRLAFVISNESNAKTLIFRQGEESRAVALDASGVK